MRARRTWGVIVILCGRTSWTRTRIIFLVSDEIWKTVCEAPIRNLVYSCLGAYGDRRAGELAGPWFTTAFEAIGHAPQAVRLALFRMVSNAGLQVRKSGRVNFYRLAPFGRAGIEAGNEMLFGERERDWDGRWTIIHFHFRTGDRLSRDHIRSILTLEGFGRLGPGLYLHPRDRGSRVLRAMEADADGHIDGVSVFRSRCVGGRTDAELVRRLWDLDGLNAGYGRFLCSVGPLRDRIAATCTNREAFFYRIGLVLSYLQVGWSDPEIPESLLPAGWLGYEAHRMARRLYEDLLPRTLAHGDRIGRRLKGSGVIPGRDADGKEGARQ